MEKKEYLEINESQSSHQPNRSTDSENWEPHSASPVNYLKEDKFWAICPYNKTHKVKATRIQAHLLKCEKVYPKLEICAYNYTHRVPKEELNFHIANCPSKVVHIDDVTAKTNILLYHPKPNPALQTQLSDPDYECWD